MTAADRHVLLWVVDLIQGDLDNADDDGFYRRGRRAIRVLRRVLDANPSIARKP